MSAKPRIIRRCQHIKVNGEQCGSPALARKRFCYFHDHWKAQEILFAGAKPLQRIATMTLPVLEDPNAVQVALMQVMQLLMTHEINTKDAGLLLYGLQTASANLRHSTLNPMPEKVVIQPGKVASIGLGEDAWTKPIPPVKEMPAEEREKFAAAALRASTDGPIEKRWDALKLWVQLGGLERAAESASGENGKGSLPP
jgi:hypothetical protein